METGYVWRKASFSGSNANCVEIAFAWRKSSRSGSNSNCVELGWSVSHTAIRDSKNPAAGHLVLPHESLRALINQL
ncbi:DUF397 domain-containing protein [Actinokineospora sp. G85]|uniref:DUF397 domain-containing protein n=1 Tax=Actinokineospora sp. G85 TaxID=3406626 RepID=UPI003C78098D